MRTTGMFLSLGRGAVALAALSILSAASAASADDHVAQRLPATAMLAGRLADSTPVSFALTLPLRDPEGLNAFVARVNDPADPEYHHFLTPGEFADEFGPTPAQYAALEASAQAAGLTVTRTFQARTVLDVSGPAAAASALFGVHFNEYVDADGKYYRVPDAQAQITGPLANLGAQVVGLDTAPVAHSHLQIAQQPHDSTAPTPHGSTPVGFSPTGIKTAYGIPTSLTCPGQTIALMELDGYDSSDIQTYCTQYGITEPTISNVYVDGATGAAGSGAEEVVLDLDMLVGMASGVGEILVYEAPDDGQSTLDCYARIADDDKAQVASTSWGLAENAQSTSYLDSESTVFAQMAAQGQSMFAAAGDDGAYDNPDTPNTLTVDDPGSQPDVTCCGGTTLTVNGSGQWVSETTWNDGQGDATGGGVSAVWPMPAYQKNAGLSGTNRLVPDVSINANPNTGYAIYFAGSRSGGWQEVGGTSACAPLWAGLIALTNQQLATNHASAIGLANDAIYADASSPAKYARDFHDITTGNNLYYSAGVGYDEATGWGTPIGSSLISDLSTPASTGTTDIYTFTPGVYMFSIPYDYSGLSLTDVFDQPVTLFYYDPLTLSYVTSPTAPADTVHQMLAYWAKFTTTTHVKSGGANLTTGQTGLSITLQVGWNMVGNPYNATVPLSDVTITPSTGGTPMSLAQANTAGYVYNTLYSYDQSTNAYVDATSLTPYAGYWIRAFQTCKITVNQP